ncbi:restriction endonuclease subunit S [Clostridium sp. JNZ J1-5]
MNINIDLALNMLYQRQIFTREQLLNEILRVKLTQKELQLKNKDIKDKDKLFQFMKKTTEDELGFFPADRDDFVEIYEALKEIDLIDFTLEIFKNDKMGTIISPGYLTAYIKDKTQKINPKKILITEAEKHLAGLRGFIKEFKESESTLTTQTKQMHLLLQLAFGDYENVRIIFESIYSRCLIDEKFDYIYSIPYFGGKRDNIGGQFITRDNDGIAIENMLEHLGENGILDIIVPAKITFAGMEYEKLRKFITNNYNVKSIFILPEGTFRPATAIKTYLFTFTKISQDEIEIGTLKPDKDIFCVEDKKQIKTKEFLSHEDWRVELLLSDDDENIKKFKNSNLEKTKLKDVAEVFRGKSILKKDTKVGSISVLNISNIENGEINYDSMDTIEEEERKIKRYELIDNDVLLSCRGTAIKSAVFKQQDKLIIASANVIVIRPNEKILGEYIKIFFESPIGMAIIKSFQRGTTIMNINHSDIMEMEIPLLSIDEQEQIIKNYNEELNIYKTAINTAENRWNKIKNNIYNKLM